MEDNKNDDKIIAYIKFNEEIKKVILTPTFEEFKKKICKVLQINENLFNSLKLSYKDEDNDTITISNEEDYSILLPQIQKKEVDILNIETEEEANIDINACTNSIIKFHEINSGEVNEEENKNKNELNVISNQQFEINKEENINIQKNNNHVNNNKNIINEEISNKKEEKVNLSFSDDDLESPYIQKKNNDINLNKMNSDNNINNIDNINNLKNINNINNNNNKNINLKNQTYMVFPYNCNLCNQYPIIKVLYYCLVCSIPLCEDCEEKLGINHRHSILKVQTKEQFDDLNSKINGNQIQENDPISQENNANQSQIQKLANNLKESFFGLFGEEKKEEKKNNNINNNVPMIPQKMSLLQLARAQYDLNGISDDQLQEAIDKSNGNIDDAIVLLMS